MRTIVTEAPLQLATLVGANPAIVALRATIDRLAGSTAPVLVTGPPGSGKTLAARLLHERGSRALRPFVTVDAAAVPRDRLHRTIFGRAAAGTLPAATPARAGCWQRAAGGTLFVAGIGRLPPAARARLVRRLARRVARGDVRLVVTASGEPAATLPPWWADVCGAGPAEVVTLPPLTARTDDFPQLVDYFAAAETAGEPPRFDASAIAYLRRQPWPGNVRDLRNFVARVAILHPGAMLDDARCAVLLHGERRAIDRWLATAADPLPMPNRRRPPPLVAANEVVDLRALLSDFDRECLRDAFGPAGTWHPIEPSASDRGGDQRLA